MHDTRAAIAARFMTRMRCLLATGLALSVLGVLAALFDRAGGALPLALCGALFGVVWFLLEQQLAGLQAAPAVMPVVPLTVQPVQAAATSDHRADAGVLFLSSMSHDLRQPVQAAGLFAATLSAHALPEASRKLVSGIESAVEQLSEQIEAVFAIARLESGRQAPAIELLAVEEFMSAVVSAHLDDAQERGLHVRHIPSRLAVKADAVLLGRALERLVQHALRTTREGGVVVGCRRRRGKAVIEVWDSSPGIPTELFGDVLKPGGRYGQELVDRGLGLVVAERCASYMGGRLGFASRAGRGSVFRLELDRA